MEQRWYKIITLKEWFEDHWSDWKRQMAVEYDDVPIEVVQSVIDVVNKDYGNTPQVAHSTPSPNGG